VRACIQPRPLVPFAGAYTPTEGGAACMQGEPNQCARFDPQFRRSFLKKRRVQVHAWSCSCFRLCLCLCLCCYRCSKTCYGCCCCLIECWTSCLNHSCCCCCSQLRMHRRQYVGLEANRIFACLQLQKDPHECLHFPWGPQKRKEMAMRLSP
jgi:hypothetical protein